MQCPYCHVGQCKRHPLQDHGESTRASLGTGPMAQLRDQFRTELLARKRRQVAMEQMGEEAMNRGSEVRLPGGPAVGWSSALTVVAVRRSSRA